MAKTLPPHGTENRYTNHRCRCQPCRSAAAKGRVARSRRAAQQAWGAPPTSIDADEVRTHVCALMAAGIPQNRIAELAGIGEGVIRNLLYGTSGRLPARKVLWANAQAILAVQPSLEALPDSARIDGSGTRRRLQGLMALGWSSLVIAARIGCSRSTAMVLAERNMVSVESSRRVRQVYAELSMAIPESSIASQRAKALAKRKGWLPPAAWDDDFIDVPDEELAAELRRQVEQWSDLDLGRAHVARWRQGDTTPLTVAASLEFKRRKYRRSTELEEAS